MLIKLAQKYISAHFILAYFNKFGWKDFLAYIFSSVFHKFDANLLNVLPRYVYFQQSFKIT